MGRGGRRKHRTAAARPNVKGELMAQEQEKKVVPRVAVIMDWPYQNVPGIYMMSLLQAIHNEEEVFIVQSKGPHSDLCFNASVKYALEQGATEILSVSCDQAVPLDILERSRAHGVDIVGALYATRQPGHDWIIYQRSMDGEFVKDTPRKPLQRVAATGAGCFWARADVFRKIQPPWFWTETDPTGCQVMVSNDFYFFHKCAAAGIQVHTDIGMVSGHQFEIELNAQSLQRSLPPRLEVTEIKKLRKEREDGARMES